MTTTILSQRSETIVPPQVRQDMGIEPGAEIEWIKLPDGRYAVAATNRSVKRLQGALKWKGATISVSQMNNDIADAAAEPPLRIVGARV